jgi:hypothetical protein
MTKWHGGKGSAPRPLSVSHDDYVNRWDLIFGRDKAKIEEIEEDDNEDLDKDEDEHDCESEE